MYMELTAPQNSSGCSSTSCGPRFNFIVVPLHCRGREGSQEVEWLNPREGRPCLSKIFWTLVDTFLA